MYPLNILAWLRLVSVVNKQHFSIHNNACMEGKTC